MDARPAPLPRRARRRAPSVRSSSPPDGPAGAATLAPSARAPAVGGEKAVRRLRLSRAVTVRESSSVFEACRRMAAMRADAALLIDGNGLLSGIITDKVLTGKEVENWKTDRWSVMMSKYEIDPILICIKAMEAVIDEMLGREDVATRVIAEGLRTEHTIVSKIMTRNPVFVTADAPAIEALQTMVQGKFRHLPVVENGEVIGLLDITKCLYDAISRIEKVAEQGSAIAAAMAGSKVESKGDFPGIFQEQSFKPPLSAIIMENTKIALALPSDPVHIATKKMRDFRVNSVIIVTGSKPHGILTSKDVLVRVVARNLSPELTLVEKVMTPNPECATLDTTILDALHMMHDGKFLHLPVLDDDGHVIACVDVLQLTQAAISIIEGGAGDVNNVSNTMMQKFWDSVLGMEQPNDEYDTHSEHSTLMASEYAETTKSSFISPDLGNMFAFKFKDGKGQLHRVSSVVDNLDVLLSTIIQRIGPGVERDKFQLLYEDDEGDKVLLTTDSDLVGAVNQARLVGSKAVKLHIAESTVMETRRSTSDLSALQSSGSIPLHVGVLAGAVALMGIGMIVYLMRAKL